MTLEHKVEMICLESHKKCQTGDVPDTRTLACVCKPKMRAGGGGGGGKNEHNLDGGGVKPFDLTTEAVE